MILHSSGDRDVAGRRYMKVRHRKDISAVHVSGLERLPALICDAHRVEAFIKVWVCLFIFPSEAISTPRDWITLKCSVQQRWCGKPEISLTCSWKGVSWMLQYCQLPLFHLKADRFLDFVSGTIAPPITLSPPPSSLEHFVSHLLLNARYPEGRRPFE